jgi:CDP-diacylglycerol--serine O-phosphatidyltransferase
MARGRFSRRSRRARRQLRLDSINRLLPNALTMLGLCAGLTAIRYGLQGNWQVAVMLVAAAALLDSLDGRIARLMGGPTEFGGQLDSLVDAISFGVAPITLIYLWSLSGAGGIGWAVTLVFVGCCVLRLARFNIAAADPDLPSWAGSFFSGVPAPAGAGLVLLPMMLNFVFGWSFVHSSALTAPWTLAVSALMISRVPTYSFKRIRVSHGMVRPAMAGIVVLAAAAISEPWATLTGLVVAYICTIPFSIRTFRRRVAEQAEEVGSADATRGTPPTDTA